MGKTRGHGSRRGAYKGSRKPAKGRGEGDEEDSSEEEEFEQQRGLREHCGSGVTDAVVLAFVGWCKRLIMVICSRSAASAAGMPMGAISHPGAAQ